LGLPWERRRLAGVWTTDCRGHQPSSETTARQAGAPGLRSGFGTQVAGSGRSRARRARGSWPMPAAPRRRPTPPHPRIIRRSRSSRNGTFLIPTVMHIPSSRPTQFPSRTLLALVGTLSSRNGMLAFFDGTTPIIARSFPGRRHCRLQGVKSRYAVPSWRRCKPVKNEGGCANATGRQRRMETGWSDELPAATPGPKLRRRTRRRSQPGFSSASEPNDVLKNSCKQRELELNEKP